MSAIKRIIGKSSDYWVGKPMDMGVVHTIIKCQQMDGYNVYFGYSIDKKTLFIVGEGLIDSEETTD